MQQQYHLQYQYHDKERQPSTAFRSPGPSKYSRKFLDDPPSAPSLLSRFGCALLRLWHRITGANANSEQHEAIDLRAERGLGLIPQVSVDPYEFCRSLSKTNPQLSDAIVNPSSPEAHGSSSLIVPPQAQVDGRKREQFEQRITAPVRTPVRPAGISPSMHVSKQRRREFPASPVDEQMVDLREPDDPIRQIPHTNLDAAVEQRRAEADRAMVARRERYHPPAEKEPAPSVNKPQAPRAATAREMNRKYEATISRKMEELRTEITDAVAKVVRAELKTRPAVPRTKTKPADLVTVSHEEVKCTSCHREKPKKLVQLDITTQCISIDPPIKKSSELKIIAPEPREEPAHIDPVAGEEEKPNPGLAEKAPPQPAHTTPKFAPKPPPVHILPPKVDLGSPLKEEEKSRPTPVVVTAEPTRTLPPPESNPFLNPGLVSRPNVSFISPAPNVSAPPAPMWTQPQMHPQTSELRAMPMADVEMRDPQPMGGFPAMNLGSQMQPPPGYHIPAMMAFQPPPMMNCQMNVPVPPPPPPQSRWANMDPFAGAPPMRGPAAAKKQEEENLFETRKVYRAQRK